MSNLRIVPKNIFDHPACVLSCTVGPILPLDNLKNYKRARIFRAPAGAPFNIKATWGGNGVYASMASLLRCNLEPAATWQFLGYSDAAWTNLVVSTATSLAIDSATLGSLDWGVQPLGSGIFDPFYGQKMAIAWFARTQILSAQITVTDPGNSSGVIDISRAWGGDYFQLTENLDWGFKNGWKESTEIWDTDGGSPHSDAAIPHRQLTFDLQNIPEGDRTQWMDILRYCGSRRDVFVSPFPTGTGAQIRDYTMDGLILPPLPDLTTVGLNRDNTNITIREV